MIRVEPHEYKCADFTFIRFKWQYSCLLVSAVHTKSAEELSCVLIFFLDFVYTKIKVRGLMVYICVAVGLMSQFMAQCVCHYMQVPHCVLHSLCLYVSHCMSLSEFV